MSESSVEPSPYERAAAAEIEKWKLPAKTGLFNTVSRWTSKPATWAAGTLDSVTKRVPGFNTIVDASVGEMLRLTSTAATFSVGREGIYAYYRDEGFPDINGPEDILTLDLQFADEVSNGLTTKYAGLAAAQGVGAGAVSTVNPVAGAAVLAGAVASLAAINLRAATEFGTYYGFGNESEEERGFAMGVLSVASATGPQERAAALQELEVYKAETYHESQWRSIQEGFFTQLLHKTARSVALRLTKYKVAQTIPGAGIAIASGFNAYYTSAVCTAAYNLYRERFLNAKYPHDDASG